MKQTAMINLCGQFLVDKTRVLGKGATGEVYLGEDTKTKQKVAVKIIELKAIDNEVTKYLLEMEKYAIMNILNPYVLKGIKVIQNNQHCFIITEYCNGGTLKSLIRSEGPLGEERTHKIIIAILMGECSLVAKGVTHRDLKPANILFHNNQVKIIDFGYCEIKGATKPNVDYNVGSPSYMAPQAFHENIYNEKTEVWAIGVTLYECLNGKTLDDGKNMGEVFKEMRKSGLKYRVHVSERFKQAIDMCLNFDPKKRPTCVQLLNYFTAEPQRRTDKPLGKQLARQVEKQIERQIQRYPQNQLELLEMRPTTSIDRFQERQSQRYSNRPSTKVLRPFFVQNVGLYQAQHKKPSDQYYGLEDCRNQDVLKKKHIRNKTNTSFSDHEPRMTFKPEKKKLEINLIASRQDFIKAKYMENAGEAKKARISVNTPKMTLTPRNSCYESISMKKQRDKIFSNFAAEPNRPIQESIAHDAIYYR